MAYPETVRYLETFVNYEKKSDYPYRKSLKLERIRDFLRAIGDPQDELKCVHIAGTKGKGTTCAFAANILRSAGYRVGLYTSPHLSDFRERIRILKPICDKPYLPAGRRRTAQHNAPNLRGRQGAACDFEGMISKKALAGLARRLKPKIESYNRNSKYGPLTFFEVYTALAFFYFKREKVDFAVLETGLGGRLDATNVVHPLVAAITPISLEHTGILGKTLKKIAREKVGIIKNQKSKVKSKNLIVISAPQRREAAAVIRESCRRQGAKLYTVGKDISFTAAKNGFCIRGVFREYAGLKIRLLGEHQLINAATAVGIIEALRERGVKTKVAQIRKGLLDTRWPGRCEIVADNPRVILDGAQNSASARMLRDTLRRYFSYEKLILILGISSDKDIEGICRWLCPMADKIILTRAATSRAAQTQHIQRIIGSIMPGSLGRIIRTEKTREAAQRALLLAGRNDLILATGSLFVVGEIRDGFIAKK